MHGLYILQGARNGAKNDNGGRIVGKKVTGKGNDKKVTYKK